MMPWYAQLIIYLITTSVSFFALWQVDFNKFMRIGRKQWAVLLYVVLALAVGAMVGLIFVTIGNAFYTATRL